MDDTLVKDAIGSPSRTFTSWAETPEGALSDFASNYPTAMALEVVKGERGGWIITWRPNI